MRSRIKELHYEYCAPKPKILINLWDIELRPYTEPSDDVRDAIDITVDIVV